jgi:uncharacterized repeat protein (TIGR01451 family)
MTRLRCTAGFLGCILLLTQSSGPAAEPPRVLKEWTFDRDGDLQGWVPNGHFADVKVAGGILAGRGAGSDPILELRVMLELPASPWQVIEIRLRADRDGAVEFFWSNTSQGRYGGFSQEKTTRFNVLGDRQWRTYRLMPFWHAEGRIVRLRFDVFDGAKFDVDFIRIAELATPPPALHADFDFTKGAQGWQPVNGTTLGFNARGASLEMPAAESFLLGPPVQIRADEQSYVSLRLAVNQGLRGTLFFATDKAHGLHSVTFPLEADGQEHTYNLDLLAAKDWRGQIIALGVRPSDGGNAKASLRSLKVSDEPQGPPQLKVVSFGLEDALPRVGLPATLTAIISNTGGETASNVQATVTLPEGLQLLSASPSPSRVATLGFDEEARFTWKIEGTNTRGAVTGFAHLAIHGSNAPSVEASAALTFTPRLNVARTGYVPEPKPARGPTEVGVYYFPGWKTASQWHPITRFPERRPVLGWYREGDPEVADWHIKWAVEHGITFFAYDWYWSQGARQLEHGLHDGYFKARYRHLLKFCLLWANHNPPKTSSHEDCLAVTRYWIENYFRRPEHLTIEGKPAMIIFSPNRLTEDLGSAGVKKAFDAMRAECRQAGLAGLHLIACVGDAGGARQAAAEGYDAVTAYNWPGLGMTGEGMYAPFETLVGAYRRHWEHIIEQSPIPLAPLPVCGGWDSRPWHGDNNLVRFGRTPELFKRHLQDAKQTLQTRNSKPGTPNLIMIEAWNEWGEGSYIEPHREFGFGYLDAIREVFTDAPKAHDDVTPADVGLGPYDVPLETPRRTAWDFAQGLDGWTAMMGLTEARVEKGVLATQTTSNDPALTSPPLQVRASEFTSVVLRMKLQRAGGRSFKDAGQLFWHTSRLSESEATSARFEVFGDGQWHDYRIPVSQNNRWRGIITRLRLDPCNQPDVVVELDSIRLVR